MMPATTPDSLFIRNVRMLDGDTISLEIQDGVIQKRFDQDKAPPENIASDRVIDGKGKLVTPTLCEPHIHLDATLTAGEPRWNQKGTLHEGIQIWGEYKQNLTEDDVCQRAIEGIRQLALHGVTRVRSHVDTTEASLATVRGLLKAQEQLSDRIRLQLVAFPQDGLYTGSENQELHESSLEMGVDLVGAIPHNEWTREDGVRSIHRALDLAEEYDRPVDAHIDETDDPHSRFTEVLVSESRKRGIDHRVTASHATAMHSYNDAYASKLIGMISKSKINVVTNPLDNSVLQGRYDSYPRRRGHTRVDQLIEAGIPVGIGHDSLQDPWYHYGQGDPIDAAFVLLHYAHMSGYEDIQTIWTMLTEHNATIWGAEDYGLDQGDEASVIIWDAETPYHALRTRAVRRYVISRGRIIVTSRSAEKNLEIDL